MRSWTDTVTLFGVLFIELLVLFVAVTFGLELLQRKWLTPSRLQRWLGGKHALTGLLKGASLGAVTPFCSCAGVPVLVGLLRGGVPFRTAMAFLIASPLLDLPMVAFIGVLFGWQVSALYVSITFLTAIALAAILDSLNMGRYVKIMAPTTVSADVASSPSGAAMLAADPSGGCCGQDTSEVSGGCGTTGDPGLWLGWRVESISAWRSSIDTLKPLIWRMLLGITIGAVIYGAVPESALVQLSELGNWIAVPVAAIVGVPLYLKGEAALPIGYALLQAGLGIGPVFALIIAAAGASIPELTMLSGVFKRKLLVAFVVCVFTVAILGGFLIPFAV